MTKIARALRLPPETVFQAAGLLPTRKDVDPWVEEQKAKLSELTDWRREMAESVIDDLFGKEQNERQAQHKPALRPAHESGAQK